VYRQYSAKVGNITTHNCVVTNPQGYDYEKWRRLLTELYAE